MGALAALSRATGWHPWCADHIIGTSAGSVFAAMTAARVPHDRLMPLGENALEDVDSLDGWLLAELAAEDSYAPRSLPRPLPGSLRLALRGIRGGGGVLKTIGGLAPAGHVSTAPIERTITRAIGPAGWVDHPNCWVVACDYETGDRVVFGRADAPAAPLAKAVAASCAIPGYFCPVAIGGRLYIDGGVHSMSNVDLLADADVDLVICLNPLSGRAASPSWVPMDRVAAAVRRLAAWQLDREIGLLLDRGIHVVVLEPTADDMAAIGYNVMDARRSLSVVNTSLRTTSEQLAHPEVAELLSMLPRPRRTRSRGPGLAALLQRAGLAAAAAL